MHFFVLKVGGPRRIEVFRGFGTCTHAYAVCNHRHCFALTTQFHKVTLNGFALQVKKSGAQWMANVLKETLIDQTENLWVRSFLASVYTVYPFSFKKNHGWDRRV